MNFRALRVAFVGVAIVAIGVASFSRLGRKRPPQNDQPVHPTLVWRAEQASKEGKDHVYLNWPTIIDYALPRTLKEALAYYDVVVAEVVKKQSFVEDNHEYIQTWYQFKILEYLHRKSITDCRTCPPALTPPAEMLPIDIDQVLVPRSGGDLIINGITISSSDPGFKAFEMNRKYVLFLIIDEPKGVGTILAGPSGTYTLDSNNLLQPFSAKSNPLAEEIHMRFKNSLLGLTEYLRSQK